MKNIYSQKIVSIELINYRNHPKLKIEFKNQNNLYGPNAIGKTNVIEAIGIIGTGKNLNVKQEKSLIQNGFEKYTIKAIITNGNNEETIEISNNLKNQKISCL